jgi:hypothetical protein
MRCQQRGVWDGETRTRTGDTTIFSRFVFVAQRREIPGKHAVLAALDGAPKSAIRGLSRAVKEMAAPHISYFAGALADPRPG